MLRTLSRVLRAALAAVGLVACAGDDASQPDSPAATAFPSGLDSTLALSEMDDMQRMQFCTAAVRTLFSATTFELECELAAISTVAALPDQASHCADISADCALSFEETEVAGCAAEIRDSQMCTATVADGEACSLHTAELRGSLLPRVSCESASDDKAMGVAAVQQANRLAETPECARYQTCRTTL